MVVVVECYCFLINIIVESPGGWPPLFIEAKRYVFAFSFISPQQNDGVRIQVLLLWPSLAACIFSTVSNEIAETAALCDSSIFLTLAS